MKRELDKLKSRGGSISVAHDHNASFHSTLQGGAVSAAFDFPKRTMESNH